MVVPPIVVLFLIAVVGVAVFFIRPKPPRY